MSWDDVVAQLNSRHVGDGYIAAEWTLAHASRFTVEQRDALIRHGYESRALPRGVSGDPAFVGHGFRGNGERGNSILRNHVCYLGGIEIDGHESSDLDNCGCCIHCDYECHSCTDAGRSHA